MKELLKKAAAEVLGTFVLVFFACGTAIVTNVDIVATALAFGLVIVAMAYTIGGISGCHINPAVSLGVLLSKKMTLKEFGVYVLSQFVGAIIGATALYGILSCAGFDFAAQPLFATNAIPDANGGIVAALLVEIILTFVFIYVILNVTSKKQTAKSAGIIIGLTLTLVHLIGIGITGTSVNPARSFGTALMSLAFGGDATALAQVWVFLLAPMAGAALAALVFKVLNNRNKSEQSEENIAETETKAE